MGWIEWLWGLLYVGFDTLTQRIWTCHLPPKPHVDPSLSDTTCIVTGATSGIGLHTAWELAKAGAHVVLACRNVKAAEQLIGQWQANQQLEAAPLLNVEVMELNLSSLKSVKDFAKRWEAEHRSLHVLINNAGIFSMGGKQAFSEDGFEEHMQVNYFAPAALTLLLLPALLRSSPSRVVNVNSAMHHLGMLNLDNLKVGVTKRRKFSSTVAYSSSKLAQLLFSSTLHRRLPTEAAVDIICVHPGEVITNVVRTLPKGLQAAYRMLTFCLFSAAEGARSVLFCATDPQVSEYARGVRDSNYPSAPYFTSSCTPIKVSAEAMDMENSAKLWSKTLELLDFPADIVEQSICGEHIAVDTMESFEEGIGRHSKSE